MTDRDDYYRKQAAEAQDRAKRATNDSDKAAWLRLVADWLALLPRRSQTPTERFDAQAKADGTQQDVSKREQ